MTSPSPAVSAALASLRERWGEVAPRPAMDVVGALALVPRPAPLALAEPVSEPTVESPAGPGWSLPRPGPADLGQVVSTGFAALDAILGPGGLPRAAAAALHGEASSGKTTLALRFAAAVQGSGGIVAYLDLARSLDPVEAVARGVRLEWLVVLVPRSLGEALAMAATLLQDRAVDLLLLDLPARGISTGPPGERERPMDLAERLGRLAALARRAEAGLLVLEPPGLPGPIREALVGSTGLRLELARRAWIRLGRDVIGQRTEVVVARNRFGPPGRRAELRILYAEGGERDACLARPDLLYDGSTPDPLHLAIPTDATPPPALAPPAPSPGAGPRLRLIPGGTRRPGRPALDGRHGPRRRSRRARARGAAGHAARGRSPARPGGGVPRSRPRR